MTSITTEFIITKKEEEGKCKKAKGIGNAKSISTQTQVCFKYITTK